MSTAVRWRIEPVLRGTVLLGLFGLTLVPFVVTSSLVYPAASGKGFVARVAIEILFAAWVILAIGSPQARPRRSPVLIAAAVLLGLVGIANFVGVDPYRGFWGTPERMAGYVSLVHLMALLIVAGSTLTTERHWRRLYAACVAVATSLAAGAIGEIAFFSAIGDLDHRAAVTMGNPALLAVYLLLNLFLTAYLMVSHRGSSLLRVVLGTALVIQAVALVSSGTRAAVYGTFVGAAVSLALIALTRLGRRARLAVLATAGVIALVLVFGTVSQLRSRVGAAVADREPAAGAIADLPAQQTGGVVIGQRPPFAQIRRLAGEDARLENGLNTRLVAWSVAARAIADRPWTGWGQESFEIVVERYRDPRLEYGKIFDRPHNALLEWAVNAGVPGAVAYAAVLVAALTMVADLGRRFSPLGASALAGLLVAYAFNGLFLFDTPTSSLLVTLVFAHLHSAWVGARPTPARPAAPRVAHALVIPVAMAAALCVTAVNLPAIQAMKLWRDADPMSDGDWDSKASWLEQALALDTFADEGLRRAYLELASAARGRRLPDTTRDRLVDRASALMQQLVERAPERSRHLVDRGRFLLTVGRAEESVADLRAALALTPAEPHTLVRLAAALERLGRKGEALGAARAAFELEPRHYWPRLLYSGMAHAGGDTELAVALLGPLSSDAMPAASVAPLLPEDVGDRLTAPDRRWLRAMLDFNARTVGYAATSGRLLELGRLLPDLQHVGAMSRVAIRVESDAAALERRQRMSDAP